MTGVCVGGGGVSYSGAGPAQQSEGVTIHRRGHQVDSHRPPASGVLLAAVEPLLHLPGLQPQGQETLCELVHGLETVSGQLCQVEGGGLVVAVEQDSLRWREDKRHGDTGRTRLRLGSIKDHLRHRYSNREPERAPVCADSFIGVTQAPIVWCTFQP